MSVPEITRFRDRLVGVLAEAIRTGVLRERDYEALLVDPDFDPVAFDRFRADAAQAGLALPEDDTDGLAAAPERAGPGEPERDLLDIYLADIGRIPLLTHPE